MEFYFSFLLSKRWLCRAKGKHIFCSQARLCDASIIWSCSSHLLVGCGKGRQEALGKVQNEARIRKVQEGTQTSTKKALPIYIYLYIYIYKVFKMGICIYIYIYRHDIMYYLYISFSIIMSISEPTGSILRFYCMACLHVINSLTGHSKFEEVARLKSLCYK